mmetsp:Transcript_24440/g.43143  ORF Transcript_24440/g.43143 Transcript_24440/m.43143 type:complete len:80 (+) Transcript_24440:478-717(+)
MLGQRLISAEALAAETSRTACPSMAAASSGTQTAQSANLKRHRRTECKVRSRAGLMQPEAPPTPGQNHKAKISYTWRSC